MLSCYTEWALNVILKKIYQSLVQLKNAVFKNYLETLVLMYFRDENINVNISFFFLILWLLVSVLWTVAPPRPPDCQHSSSLERIPTLPVLWPLTLTCLSLVKKKQSRSWDVTFFFSSVFVLPTAVFSHSCCSGGAPRRTSVNTASARPQQRSQEITSSEPSVNAVHGESRRGHVGPGSHCWLGLNPDLEPHLTRCQKIFRVL